MLRIWASFSFTSSGVLLFIALDMELAGETVDAEQQSRIEGVRARLVRHGPVLKVDQVGLPLHVGVFGQALAKSGLHGAKYLLLPAHLQDLLGLPTGDDYPMLAQIEQKCPQRWVVETSS